MYLYRDHYKVFFDTSREGMYITTKEGYFIDANPSFCQMLSFTKLEILRRHVDDILALPMERRRFRSEIDSSGAVTAFRIKLRDKRGEEVACSISAVVLRDFEGNIDGYIGMVRLVKPQTLSPEEAEAQHFSLALRGSHDGVWNWDLKRGEVQFSSRWKALLGYSSYELSNSIFEWFDRVHPEDMNQLKQGIQSCIVGTTPALSTYFRMKNRSDEFLWMMVRAVGDFDENGKCTSLAGSLSNITAHMKLLETLTKDKAVLSRYFSGDMLSQLLQTGSSRLKETSGKAAILVLKVLNVHELWQTLGSTAYAEFLNELLTDLMDLVYGHRGSVNKILGDTLLVSFGCPLSDEDDLERAVECARELVGYLQTFNDVRPEFLSERLELALGLAWGDVFSATLGSVHRLEYTLVGQPVHRATKLQQLSEKLKVPLLLDDSVRQKFPLRFPFVSAAEGFPGVWTLSSDSSGSISR
ncbi:MAG: PAS domain-containing protein [Spirochaetales bacterium]|nr:PAS domain-containing protein [Spirochaetales bacterium]